MAKILLEEVKYLQLHEKDFQLLQNLCVRVTEANNNIKARPRDITHNPVVDLCYSNLFGSRPLQGIFFLFKLR